MPNNIMPTVLCVCDEHYTCDNEDVCKLEDGKRRFTTDDYCPSVINDTPEDKKRIAEFVFQRLYRRYIKPFEYKSEDYRQQYKNGFAMMANCCLLIETFQSFWEGKETSKKISGELFQHFFEAHQSEFPSMDKKIEGGDDNGKNCFYVNVRCGILHQGETTGGWKIVRQWTETKTDDNDDNNDVFDKDNLTIHATNFAKEMKKVLLKYRDDLINSNTTDDLWKNCCVKLGCIVKNCEIKQ